MNGFKTSMLLTKFEKKVLPKVNNRKWNRWQDFGGERHHHLDPEIL